MNFDYYISELQRILERIRTEQRQPILDAARLIADCLLSGGIVHAFGSGHSHMLSEEIFYRAGGLAPVNPIFDRCLQFFDGALESTLAERENGYAAKILEREDIRPGDVAVLVSNSGRNAVPVEMAMGMRSRGVKVIALTNLAQSRGTASRHTSGKRLFELADVVLDNCVPDGDATTPLPGLPFRMGPASTVAGAAILHSVLIETALLLRAAGAEVPVLASANVGAPSGQNLGEMLGKLAPRIRYYRSAAGFDKI